MAKRGASTDPTRADQEKYRPQIGEEVRVPLTESQLAKLDEMIEGVPDVNNPRKINYSRKLDDYDVYIEGWSDKCLAGTGFPPMEEGETARKIGYIEDLTPGILEREAKERGLELVDGGFRELPDATYLYGVTWGVYRKRSSNPGHNPGSKEPVTYTVFFERPDIVGMSTPVGIENLSSVSDANKAIKSMLEDAVREHPTVAGSSKINQIRVVKTVGEHSTELYRWTGVDIHRPSDYQIPLTKAEHHSWSTPRAIAAIATGVITGLVGSAVPVVGLAGGLLAQVFEKQTPQLLKAQHLTAGVVDGSAALLARSLFRSAQARPMKLTLTEDELDKLEFEAAKKGEYVPSPPRPTKEQFKEILREKLLKKD